MAAGLPAGGKVEIEFTAGVWTDVSADVEGDAYTIRKGRTSEFSAPSPGTLDGLRLDNTTGKFTPLSQVLADGVTANPYYPNILPRKRIRVSNTPAGVRFLGYVKGWPPFVDQNGTAWVTISATDRQDQGSRIVLNSPIAQEVAASAPRLCYPLTDAAGATSAAELSGGPSLGLVGAGTALTFGDVGPGYGDGTGVKFAPNAQTSGQYLFGKVALGVLGAYTIEAWFNIGTALSSWGSPNYGVSIDDNGGGYGATIYTGSGGASFTDVTGYCNALSILDGGWHHVAARRTAAGAAVDLYVDGVYRVSTAGSSTATTAVTNLSIGESTGLPGQARFQGNIGRVGIYNVALTPTQIAAHASATNGYAGDTTAQRIARWLGVAGLTSSDWNLDVGKAIVGTYPQAGKDVIAACQDMAVTEGGGSAFYFGADGKARFANRIYRKPAAPVMTLDAEADLDGGVYAPSFDEMTLVNYSTGNRATQSGTQSTQVAQNAASQAVYGLSTDSSGVTSYATTDADVIGLAQYNVAANGSPGFRLPQVGVDMVTATASLYAALASVQIGSRIRLTNLPVAMAPSTILDLIVEGWTETISKDAYHVVFDTSPADNPARGVYDDVSYGRYQAQGNTLTAAITASATSLSISTTAGLPVFTMTAGAYPLKIQVGQEILTLTAASGSSTSPQSFTVTRGSNGTTASAQVIGAPVTLWPSATYTLL